MSWIGLIGPLTGLLALVVTVVNALAQRRGQGHAERVDDERLGHADLVAALETYRGQLADERSDKAAERVECERQIAAMKVEHARALAAATLETERERARADKASQQASDLLRMIARHK